MPFEKNLLKEKKKDEQIWSLAIFWQEV